VPQAQPATCHDPPPHGSTATTLVLPPAASLILGLPRPAFVLATALGLVGIVSGGYVLAVPFEAAAFGGLTVPVVLASGAADGLNPCAFALLVLFATYTLTLVNAVTADGSPTLEARRRLLGAGSLYVGAVWITYFLIGLGLFTFLAWLGQDHLAVRIAAVVALLMALWMLKDVFLPGWGPSIVAPAGTHGRMHRAIERGGLAGMLGAGVLVGICTVPCSGAIYLDIVAVLNASGGGTTGLALLALYNLAYIAPLVVMLAAVSNRRVFGPAGTLESGQLAVGQGRPGHRGPRHELRSADHPVTPGWTRRRSRETIPPRSIRRTALAGTLPPIETVPGKENRMQPRRILLLSTSGGSSTASAGNPTVAAPRIEVELTDAFEIKLAESTVPVGVPVTFVVHNGGALEHEYFLGDEAEQAEHEREMTKMDGMAHDEPNGISVDPGETKELTFTFEAAGETLAGCHVPGHYVSGMKAPITIQG
jgi:cytochrome c-type biogenesis protein